MSIKLLDELTIDKIAAGEVVERPASVVKELVENSIDANATIISVETDNGGISRIRVTDNGSGIDRDDVPLAFYRHATSKIDDIKNLESIRSLGFRGEALASIAAVSRTCIITKTADDITGTKYTIEGGKSLSLDEIGAPNGTTIIVEDMFYNTPARKKFLKSENSEANKIRTLMEHLALSRPDISFKLVQNGKEKLSTSGSNSLQNTVLEILGRQVASNMLSIEYEDETIKVNGFIGKSILSRSNRGYEFFFINGRYIKSDTLSKALEDGYVGFLMGNQFPSALINIEFADGCVDVNVHPTKMEVRFDTPDIVSDKLKEIVSNRLTKREDIEIASIDSEHKSKKEDTFVSKSVMSFEPFEIKAKEENDIKKEFEEELKEKAIPNNEVVKEYAQSFFLSEKARKSQRILGQVFGTYWLIEYDGKLYILDQHAAAEKVLFERIMNDLKTRNLTSQSISPPIIVPIMADEKEALTECEDALIKMGFNVEEFGKNEVAISAIPAEFSNMDIRETFLSILSERYKKDGTDSLILEKVATIACKAAVKGNTNMSVMEVEALLDELMTLDNPYHCPHGRPTFIAFSRYDLDKKFKRII